MYRRQGAGSSQTRSLGVESLRLARVNIATSQTIYICCDGTVDYYSRRLTVEVLLVLARPGGNLVSNGEVMITAGLSFPVGDPPRSYCAALSKAETRGAGMYTVFPPELANVPHLRPPTLRRAQLPVSTERDGVTYSVAFGSPFRSESHVCVCQSTIPGAGMGLFLYARPPARSHEGVQRPAADMFLPGKTYVCLYSSRTVPRAEANRLDNTDYVMENQSGIYNPVTYDGANLGRFVNQGRLIPALHKMVEVSKRYRPLGPDWKAVFGVAESHCNVVYHFVRGVGLTVQLKEGAHLLDSSQEHVGNYDIRGYWLANFVRKVRELGTSDECVSAVLWCACSPESNWGQRDRNNVHQTLRECGHDPRDFSNVLCPWPVSAP